MSARVLAVGSLTIQPPPLPPDTPTAASAEQGRTSPANEMLRLIAGFWISRAIFVAARLGLPDHLHSGPRSAEELAAATGTHAPSLYRLLRALAGEGVFTEDDRRRFALTPLGETLRSEAPGSLRHFAIAELGLDHYQAWEHLPYSVRTGEAAFEHRLGVPLREYYRHQPENGEIFRRSLAGLTEAAQAAILRSYDFSGVHIVVEVGGGEGTLIAALLQAHPALRGILLELPEVRPGAERYLEAAGVGVSCAVVEGDAFQEIPAGGDAYLLRWILHDWDDERALTILRNCRRAIAPNGRLLLFESVVPEGGEPSLAKWLDLERLVMVGGHERTASEYRELLAAADFRLARILPTGSVLEIIEAIPA